MRKGIFLLAFLAACSSGPPTGGVPGEKPVEEAPAESFTPRPTPSFSLDRLGGGTFTSAELSGKPVMVNFWHPK